MNIRELVAQLARSISVDQKHLDIINNIDPCFKTNAEEKMLSGVINQMLVEASQHNADKSIKLWAKQFHDLTVIHVKYNDKREESCIQNSLKDADTMAEQIGGCLYVSNSTMNGTAIALTFLTTRNRRVTIPVVENAYAYSNLSPIKSRRLSA